MFTDVDAQTQSIPVAASQQLIQRSVPTLERLVDDAIAARPAAIDLVVSAVQIVDSGGLNWLLALHARLDTLNIRLRLTNPSPVITDALAATRLDARLAVAGAAVADTQGGTHGRS
jgi:anti-anti-sigma factor